MSPFDFIVLMVASVPQDRAMYVAALARSIIVSLVLVVHRLLTSSLVNNAVWPAA